MDGPIAMVACILGIVGVCLIVSHQLIAGAAATGLYMALAYVLNQRLARHNTTREE